VTEVQSPSLSDLSVPTPCLSEVAALLARLNQSEIRYCYWGDRSQLRPALLGEAGLELLISPHDAEPMAQILGQSTCRRCGAFPAPSPARSESFLGLDEPTGGLFHLRLHYHLTSGSKCPGALPWEPLLLSTRTFSRSEGLYVADPQLQLLEFAVRKALNIGWGDFGMASPGRLAFDADGLRKFRSLVALTDPHRLSCLAGMLLGPDSARLLSEIASGRPPTLYTMHCLRRTIQREVRVSNSDSTVEVTGQRWWKRLFVPRRNGPRSLHRGLVIAFLGVDGSGKSTIVTELNRWLQGRVDTTWVYFGGGQGPISPVRRALRAIASRARRGRRSARASARPGGLGHSTSYIRTAGEIMWVLLLARERRRRATRVRQVRSQGGIALCDRFPQSQQVGNDGPWLGHWMEHRSWVKRTTARKELEAIQCAERLRPDLVIRLNVTPLVALQRKPGSAADRNANLQLLKQLRFAQETQVIEIDATRPLGQVLIDVKREIWRRVSG
jgi:thymidylate kinase